jgi:ComEC/Rec2-related protein
VTRGEHQQPAFGRLLVSTPGNPFEGLFADQVVEVTGVISFPPGPQAPGLFDYRAYLVRQGISFELRPESTNQWSLLSPNRGAPWSDRFLDWAQKALARGLPEEDEALKLIWSMTLGWKTGMTQEIYLPFMTSGTMHIFAISGLHIVLIAAILTALLRSCRIPRGICGLVIIPLIWFYTGATGWQPSAIRSTIMMTVVLGGWALNRPGNLLNSLAAAALIILLWDPQQVFGASFQLSFFVVLSLALFMPTWNRGIEWLIPRVLRLDPLLPSGLVPRWKRWLEPALRYLCLSLGTSFAAWVGALPLTAFYFHMFSPITLLANLVIVPASSAALACNLGAILCGAWLPFLAELFNFSAWFWMTCIIRISEWASSLPAAYWYVPSPGAFEFVAYYALLLGLLTGVFLRPSWRIWAVAACVVLAGVYAILQIQSHRAIRLVALPLNGGMSVYFHAPNLGPDLLLDTGNSNAVRFVTEPFLHAQGVNRVRRMALTHGDARHVGGADRLAESFNSRILISPLKFRSPVYRRIVSEFEKDGPRVQRVSAGDKLGCWEVLHPAAEDKFAQADDGAMVLRGTLAGTRVLLLSDLGRKGQEALLARNMDLRADILISGLPASGEPLSQGLLEAAAPRLVIVCDSETPSSERARPELMQRLREGKFALIFTRFSGATTIEFGPGRWEARSLKGMRVTEGKEGQVSIAGAEVVPERAEPKEPPATAPENE